MTEAVNVMDNPVNHKVFRRQIVAGLVAYALALIIIALEVQYWSLRNIAIVVNSPDSCILYPILFWMGQGLPQASVQGWR